MNQSISLGTFTFFFRSSVFILCVLLCTVGVQAQDDHYWSQQYGANSTLMGGAVIAGVRDNSAIFYNPGALGFIQHPSLSVDANVYKIDKVFIDDGVGNGVDLNSAQLWIYPQIISGLINIIKNDKWKFSYALLTRQYANILMNTRYTQADFSADKINPGDKFMGAVDYNNSLNEQWGGLGSSYRINDHLSVGATVFISYRFQSYQFSNYLRYLLKTDTVSELITLNNDKTLKYKTFSGLLKFGLAWQSGKWKLGLNVTTPTLEFYGNGNIQKEESVVELDSSSGAGYMVMDRLSNIKAKYRSPLSIGTGAEFSGKTTRISLSCEYYFAIKSYHLFETDSDPFVYPASMDTGSTHERLRSFLHVQNAARAVFNVGIGFSQDLGTKFTLMLGARTDFSSFALPDEGDKYLHNSAGWDIYHFTGGVAYHQKRNSVSLGFTYSYSPGTSVNNEDIILPVEPSTTARVYAQSFGIVIGYTYYFPK